MTAVTPNPVSPFADADPRYRHLLAQLVFVPGTPRPGVLHPTGCDRLAVVPADLVEVTDPRQLPDGLCPVCVAAMRGGAPLGDTRPLAACRECGGSTRHEGLCALCRQELHDAWWPERHRATAPDGR